MLNVLIVEDDLESSVLLVNLLSQNIKYRIAGICSDGEEAYDRIKENEVDVVLLDLGIPKLNGIEVLRKLKELKKLPKIIIISGDKLLITEIFIEKLPVYYAFSKPFNIENILLTLKEIDESRLGKEDNVKLIQDKLNEFEFNTTSIGYKYLVQCIEYCLTIGQVPTPLEKKLFSKIAKKNNISDFRKVKWSVEKTLLTMLRYTDRKVINSVFVHNERPSPKIFISKIYELISNE